MKLRPKTVATVLVVSVLIFYFYKPVKKYITNHPIVSDITIDMFNNTNSTIIGNVGNVQGDFNVNN